jgi:hypothetical protein
MKKLLVLLFSLFFLFSSSVFADDISDFSIEGISIGDSLLEYMTEDEILKEIEENKDYYFYLKEPNKYAEVFLPKNFSTYKFISVYIKNNATNKYVTNKNEKYIILTVRGIIDYIEDFEGCLQKRDEIVEVLSIMFPNVEKIEDSNSPHPNDPSGNSITDVLFFNFDSGAEIHASCDNFEETFRIKKNWTEGLNVAIATEEILSWTRDRL